MKVTLFGPLPDDQTLNLGQLEARLSWDPEKAPHERSGDDFPEV